MRVVVEQDGEQIDGWATAYTATEVYVSWSAGHGYDRTAWWPASSVRRA